MTTRSARRLAFALSVGAGLTLMLGATPAAMAGGKSGVSMSGASKSSGMQSSGMKASGMNDGAGSRRDRRGQDPVAGPGTPPPAVKPIRGIQVRCDGHRCGPYNPFQEYPNRRAQVRDHRD
jgi:hypothetical protein